MIDQGAKLYTAEVGGWFDCGKPDTLLETNLEMLRRGYAHLPPGLPDTVRIRGEVAIEDDATVLDSEIGPNVSIASGATVSRCRLRDCIVGAETRIEACDLHDSIVGDHAELVGVRGRVNVGDHSRVHGGGGDEG